MDIVFGSLEVTGDFRLINIKELSFDRDFMIQPGSRVIRFAGAEMDLQFVNIARILIRASLMVPEVTCHFLADTDLGSTVANFTFSAKRYKMEIENEENRSCVRLVQRF